MVLTTARDCKGLALFFVSSVCEYVFPINSIGDVADLRPVAPSVGGYGFRRRRWRRRHGSGGVEIVAVLLLVAPRESIRRRR